MPRRHRAVTAGLLVAALAMFGSLGGCAAPAKDGEAEAARRTGSYCYRTLADVDCYDAPLPRGEGRLIDPASP